MVDNKILNSVFDNDMNQSIMDFAQTITDTDADVFIVMSRKAACFIRFLERHGNIAFNGELVTDRILDINLQQFAGKKVVIIDDVIVSGTTIYSIITRLKTVHVQNIRVLVLGVNEKYYNPRLFQYTDEDGNEKNYLQAPYIPVSDAACMRICSNIVSTFALDLSPYDVDFPRYDLVTISKNRFNQIVSCSDWRSYDVSSDLQSQNNILNITLLPTSRINRLFDDSLGIPISLMGFYKIRLFAKFNTQKNQYDVNAVPFFLFNEVSAGDINKIFCLWFANKITDTISSIAKVRILQYVLAKKLFDIWTDSVNNLFSKKLRWNIDKTAFCLIFPKEYYCHVLDVAESTDKINCCLNTFKLKPHFEYNDNVFQSKIGIPNDQNDNIAVLQAKLIEPFTNLYFTKEKESRQLVLKYGAKAFDNVEYKQIIERLKHGYSYHMLINLLDGFPDVYDKVTTVSLFIDEAIDAGIIVPIIAEEHSDEYGTIYFRAYRHGEDVPFGELQEKLCSVLLTNYVKEGGAKILTNLRVEKLLVLFIRIGMKQGIFKPSPQDSIYYNVNIDAYLHGNIATVQDTTSIRPRHYLRHRTDARWLSEVLKDKGILLTDDKDGIKGVNDNIDIAIDKTTLGKVAAIGQTFAKLYKNSESKKSPFVTDADLVLFSTCMNPQDILNALAAELAIFSDRWKSSQGQISWLIDNEPPKVVEVIVQGDIYTSINSGQLKFFNFIDKKAQQRIDEISEQLNSSDGLSIYGTIWDQFWSENRRWENDSINRELFNTILSEGKYLLILNLLCRLLFFSVLSPNEVIERKKWAEQIMDYLQKLNSDIFERFDELKQLAKLSNSVIQSPPMDNGIDTSVSTKICSRISGTVNHIESILSDVELLVDRHGKPCKITRYVHALYVNVPEAMFPAVGQALESLFASYQIDFQTFPIAEPSFEFPEAGMWFFIKGMQLPNLCQLISKCVNKSNAIRLKINSIKVFYNLSESLRLKMSNYCNTRRNFGMFRNYAATFTRSEIPEYIPVPVIWILEESQPNAKIIEELTKTTNVLFTVASTMSVKYDTYVSSSSTVICTRFLTTVERYRKEYKNMRKKCKVFVSYSEDSFEHIERIRKVVNRLESEDFIVHFFEDAPLGTDMIDFMRKIETSDITLVFGSPEYRDKANNKLKSGVSFEDRILSGVFMSEQREKIVPIAFGDIDKSFPSPFNKLKGMKLTGPTAEEMDALVAALIRRFIENKKQKRK